MDCMADNSSDYHNANADAINLRRRKRHETDEKYREERKAVTKARAQTPEGKAANKEYNRSYAGKARAKKHRVKRKDTPKFQEWQRTYFRERYRNGTPEIRLKHDARAAVNWAVRLNLIVKPTTCQHPGKYGVQCSPGMITGHHHKGYAKEHWIDVEWLCPACHRAADALQRQQAI